MAKHLPDIIEVFRPQSLSLIEAAGRNLGINVEATRRTFALKQWLQEQHPLALDKPPPTPLPENLWGEKWRFATLSAADVEEAFSDRPIPILHMPEYLKPINLGLASTLPVPGVIIYGGRQSMRLVAVVTTSASRVAFLHCWCARWFNIRSRFGR